jgi:hemerythrin superfamily protein
MDAISLLKQDHKTVNDLFDEYEKTSDRSAKNRQSLANKISEELVRHMHIEERLFYPMAHERLDQDDKWHVIESLEEHHVVKLCLDEISRLKPDSDRYDAKVKVIKDVVLHHVESEEKEIFPLVQKKVGADELEQLGEQLSSIKKEVSIDPDPYGPDVPGAKRTTVRGRGRITTQRQLAARTAKPSKTGARAPAKTTGKTAGKRAGKKVGKTAAKSRGRSKSTSKKW